MWLLLACVPAAENDDDGKVNVQGWVYDSPIAGDGEVVSTGSVTFLDQALVEMAVGEQPFPDYPGYWRAELDSGVEYTAVIDGGEGYHPAIWKGRAPTGDGLIFPMFGWNVDHVDPFFEGLEEGVGIDIHVGTEALVHVWGATLDRDSIHADDISILSNGGAGGVLAFVVEDGVLVEAEPDGPVDYFFAFNLEPGEITVVLDQDGTVTEEFYGAQGGDIVAAWYFQGVR
ncbi:MAG: hypothetical protein GY913_33740 [Proteobacteria bacterium]|nr:hypothetical protein [Pseudomonadota bacterium]MCP4921891.1 hypothetical protein [Pseudomonadota bacterium]